MFGKRYATLIVYLTSTCRFKALSEDQILSHAGKVGWKIRQCVSKWDFLKDWEIRLIARGDLAIYMFNGTYRVGGSLEENIIRFPGPSLQPWQQDLVIAVRPYFVRWELYDSIQWSKGFPFGQNGHWTADLFSGTSMNPFHYRIG